MWFVVGLELDRDNRRREQLRGWGCAFGDGGFGVVWICRSVYTALGRITKSREDRAYDGLQGWCSMYFILGVHAGLLSHLSPLRPCLEYISEPRGSSHLRSNAAISNLLSRMPKQAKIITRKCTMPLSKINRYARSASLCLRSVVGSMSLKSHISFLFLLLFLFRKWR